MKNFRIFFLWVSMSTTLMVSCTKEISTKTDTQEVNEPTPPRLTDDNATNTSLASDPVLLATIEDSERKVEFYHVIDGELEHIFIGEKIPANQDGSLGILGLYIGAEPYEVFEAITDESVAMPEIIARNISDKSIKTKRKIDFSNETLKIATGKFEKIMSKSCYDEGEAGFKSNRCDPSPTFGSTIKYCDNKAVNKSPVRDTHILGTGWVKRRHADTWTNNICGTWDIQFFLWDGVKWVKYFERTNGNGIWRWVQTSNQSLSRHVKRVRANTDEGKQRSFTHFW